GEDAPLPGRCSVQQSPPQRVEADRAQVQCPAVEFLEIESRARCGAGFVSDVLPQPLADLVARCLAGTPDVACELERGEGPVHGDVLREELPRLSTVPDATAEVGRGFEPEVESDVDDHA